MKQLVTLLFFVFLNKMVVGQLEHASTRYSRARKKKNINQQYSETMCGLFLKAWLRVFLSFISAK